MRKYGSGWYKESYRHALAARGVQTNRYFRRKGRGGPAQQPPKFRTFPAETTEEKISRFAVSNAAAYIDPEKLRGLSPQEKAKLIGEERQKRINRANELSENIEDLQVRKDKVQDKIDALTGRALPTDSEGAIKDLESAYGKTPKYVEEREKLRSLRSERNKLTAQLRAMKEGSGDVAGMVSTERRLDDIEDSINAIMKSDAAGLVKAYDERRKELQGQVTELNKQISKNRDELDILQGKGGRKASTSGSTLPRERVAGGQIRATQLKNAQKEIQKMERALEGVDRASAQQLQQFKEAVESQQDAGLLTEDQYAKALATIGRAEKRAGLKTKAEFGEVSLTGLQRKEGFRAAPGTKMTREIITTKKQVPVKQEPEGEKE